MATTFRPTPNELLAERDALRDALQGAGGAAPLAGDEAAAARKKEAIAAALVVTSCESAGDPRPNVAHSGNCSFCGGGPHSLLRTPAAVAGAKALHQELVAVNPNFATRQDGKMLGVLICRNEKNEEVVLKAYSGPGNAIVNSRNDWTATQVSTGIENFKGQNRLYVDEDVIDNPKGNCAAQKLLHAAAVYGREEYAKRMSALETELEEAEEDLPKASDYARTKDDVLAGRLRVLPDSDEKERWKEVLNGDGSVEVKAAARQAAIDALVAYLAKQEDAALAVGKVEDVRDRLRQLDANPPRLVPAGLAEIWIGEEKGGFPQKRNGEIIDSCYTCHNTVGDALCGLQELQAEHERQYPDSIPKLLPPPVQ
jgi:hypothetical protein